MELILPPDHSPSSTPFLDLLDRPGQARTVALRLTAIIEASYAEDLRRMPRDALAASRLRTQAEDKRRAELCFRWFRDMRHAGHSLQRALDELPRALRAELDGTPFTMPDPRRLWSPA